MNGSPMAAHFQHACNILHCLFNITVLLYSHQSILMLYAMKNITKAYSHFKFETILYTCIPCVVRSNNIKMNMELFSLLRYVCI